MHTKNVWKWSSAKTAKAGKGFALFISNEVIVNIMRIIKPLENAGLLIDGVTEKLKYEIKKQEGRFLAPLLAHMAASLIAPVTSSLVEGIFGKGSTRAGKSVVRAGIK